MAWFAAVMRSRAVGIALATTYLYPPGIMVYIWVRYVFPGHPGLVFELIFAAFFIVFCWYGFGWFYHYLRQALDSEKQ